MQCQDVRIPVRTEITKRSVVYVAPLDQFQQSFILTGQAMSQASEFFSYYIIIPNKATRQSCGSFKKFLALSLRKRFESKRKLNYSRRV